MTGYGGVGEAVVHPLSAAGSPFTTEWARERLSLVQKEAYAALAEQMYRDAGMLDEPTSGGIVGVDVDVIYRGEPIPLGPIGWSRQAWLALRSQHVRQSWVFGVSLSVLIPCASSAENAKFGARQRKRRRR